MASRTLSCERDSYNAFLSSMSFAFAAFGSLPYLARIAVVDPSPSSNALISAICSSISVCFLFAAAN